MISPKNSVDCSKHELLETSNCSADAVDDDHFCSPNRNNDSVNTKISNENNPICFSPNSNCGASTPNWKGEPVNKCTPLSPINYSVVSWKRNSGNVSQCFSPCKDNSAFSTSMENSAVSWMRLEESQLSSSSKINDSLQSCIFSVDTPEKQLLPASCNEDEQPSNSSGFQRGVIYSCGEYQWTSGFASDDDCHNGNAYALHNSTCDQGAISNYRSNIG